MDPHPSPLPDYMNAVGLLNRREIEARLLAPLLGALCVEFDRERVWEITRKVIREIAYQQGVQLANSMEVNDIEHFALAQEAWKKDNAILTEVLELNRKKFVFNVFRCRYAEMYQHLGVPELGKMMSCDRDFSLIEAIILRSISPAPRPSWKVQISVTFASSLGPVKNPNGNLLDAAFLLC
jgi:hypothetical protein